MAEDQDDDLEGVEPDGEDGESAEPKKSLPLRKLLLVMVPLLLLGGGGAAMYVVDPLGLFGAAMSGDPEDEAPKPVVFFDMPDMLVNLSHKDKRSQYLKLKVAFEMTDLEARQAIQPMLPRIMDIFQVYLRELRSEDLEGSAGIYRLKEELLRRINLVLNPRRVDRILFKEMIVQ